LSKVCISGAWPPVDTDGMESRLGSFRRHDRPGLPVLVVDGDIDDRLVGAFADAIVMAILDAPGSVILDMRGVTFLGSTGIAALITGEALAHDHDVDLVVEPSAIVRRVLEITGLADFFALPAHVC
jgi:anti-sigma B factor antagonist